MADAGAGAPHGDVRAQGDVRGPDAPERPPDELVGRVINDRFRVVELIARGGMGKVYRAEQAPLGRQVALKVLTPSYHGEGDPEFHKRFFLEASTCSKLTHPNTVTIFDYGRTDDDIYYIAMELLEGRTLHRALRDDGPIEAERAMHIARQVCRSLREAHGLGVIHRDLKPANIFLVTGDESDFVKVLDFGLVKDLEASGEDLTQTGLFMGSPKYMSPEQIKGEAVDSRADVYALGVILFEMLTGTVPFDRTNSVNILMAHVHEAPPALTDANPDIEVPPGLAGVVRRALAKDPAARFAGMDEMLVALKDLAIDHGLAVTRSQELALTGDSAVHATGPRIDSRTAETTSDIPIADASHSSLSAPLSGGAPMASGAVSVTGPPSRAPFVMAGIGLLALTAAVIVALSMGGERAPRPTAPTPAPAPVVAPPPAPAPPTVESTLVRLRSEPPGATVTVGESTYGPTPTDVEWVGEDATRGRQVRFVFSLDGHQDYRVTRVITGDALEVEAELEAIQPVPRPTPGRRGRPPPRPDRGEGEVRGYKQDPY